MNDSGGPGLGGLGALVGSTIGNGAAVVGDLLVGGTVGTLNALGNAASGLTSGVVNGLGLGPRQGPVIVVPAGSPYPYASGPYPYNSVPYRGWNTEEGEEKAAAEPAKEE
jgi:hypothetical protein